MMRYQVQPLLLRQNDLWSGGVIQQLSYGEGEEQKSWYCLGEVDGKGGWLPVRVQGKVGYAYASEGQATHVCDSMNAPKG